MPSGRLRAHNDTRREWEFAPALAAVSLIGLDLTPLGRVHLRSRCEADVVKGCRTNSICIMRTDKEPGSDVGIHGQRLRDNQCPVHTIA